jgi:hypothetical protein
MRARLLAIKVELRGTMHDAIAKPGAWIKWMLQGEGHWTGFSSRIRAILYNTEKISGRNALTSKCGL